MSANAAIRRQSVFSGLPCRAETLWLSKALLLLVFFVVVVVFSIGSHGTGVVTYIHLADLLIFLWVSCWQICHTWHGSCGFWHLSVLFLSFPICHVRQRNIPSEPIFVPRPTLQSGQILFFLVGFSGHKFPHPVLGKSVILPIQDPMVLSRNEKCLLLSVLMSWKKNGMIRCGRLMMSYERMNPSWFCVPVVFRYLLIRICILHCFARHR